MTYLAEYMAQMCVNWSSYVDENCLMVLFSPFGNVIGVSVDRENHTDISKGNLNKILALNNQDRDMCYS